MTEQELKTDVSPWSPTERPHVIPMLATHLPFGLAAETLQVLSLTIRIEEMQQQLNSGRFSSYLEDRTPDPPLQYDSSGRRINTKEFLMRQQVYRERNTAIWLLLKLCPDFRPPPDYRPPPQPARMHTQGRRSGDRQSADDAAGPEGVPPARPTRLQRKIWVPVKEYPHYNFVGILLGPRGRTQKELENTNKCRIFIRGRGSVKEGRANATSAGSARRDVPPNREEEELHVIVTAEGEDDLERGCTAVQKLLIPLNDEDNEHKQRQLLILAELNGTLREGEIRRLEEEERSRYLRGQNLSAALAAGASALVPSADAPDGDPAATAAAFAEDAASAGFSLPVAGASGERGTAGGAADPATVSANPLFEGTSIGDSLATQLRDERREFAEIAGKRSRIFRTPWGSVIDAEGNDVAHIVRHGGGSVLASASSGDVLSAADTSVSRADMDMDRVFADYLAGIESSSGLPPPSAYDGHDRDPAFLRRDRVSPLEIDDLPPAGGSFLAEAVPNTQRSAANEAMPGQIRPGNAAETGHDIGAARGGTLPAVSVGLPMAPPFTMPESYPVMGSMLLPTVAVPPGPGMVSLASLSVGHPFSVPPPDFFGGPPKAKHARH